ncbi:probable gluconokinase isoform X2 [Melanotaenia boesemani]|uniref:probable gluconokinase isoform X2 n=1 Tax=Melanotaenia boesemani TaxID=1250792 RepID=UPI001C04FCE3|nr:probable gluconokinase isoform X2 [Melanotaenia boesemani]XP_041855085.1 probable gluconokinase isoform X2 [Melanotaenia boesemani]XP_041855086.1 probable gluconokinase isoform X2 [Melanotaenia boesemani]XP_041855087.1 probable gluconokinase isoform X2 [Melanotaenia boesemani]XP_041855088.1 probable gluconokinase isoform X2 [Melanotaenia boesemani]
MIYIIMGVSGSGKSSLGMFLSEKLGWPFHEGDNYHPWENIQKMAHGEPLTDKDRLPWLLKLHEVIERERSSGSDAFMACSALKRQYRQILLYGSTALTTSSSGSLQDILPPTLPDVFFLYLYGDYDFIYQRMVARKGHYMRADLLRSQFDVLEPPLDEENALSLDIRRGITDMAGEVQKHIISQRPSSAVES